MIASQWKPSWRVEQWLSSKRSTRGTLHLFSLVSHRESYVRTMTIRIAVKTIAYCCFHFEEQFLVMLGKWSQKDRFCSKPIRCKSESQREPMQTSLE